MLSLDTTKALIDDFLDWPPARARLDLHVELLRLESNEAEFYLGIIHHRPGLKLTSEEWFELLSRLPNRILRSELPVEKMLSHSQLRRLPPPIG